MDNMPTVDMSKTIGHLESYELEVEEVRKKLSRLNPSKSPGADNLHPRILREMKDVLDKPLAMLYQRSLLKGSDTSGLEACKSNSNIQEGREKKAK